MINRVIWESRHKFVYYDYETKDYFIDLDCKYPAVLNSDEPIIVYIQDEGLPEINTDLNLDKSIIKSFHDRYYELLIFLEIIDTITNSIDNQELNKRLGRLFRLCSCIGTKEDIKDIRVLRSLLIDSKYMFRDAYIEYMETGKLDFYDKVPIPFILMDSLVPILKSCIGLNKYFSILIDFTDDVSKYTCMSINNYIASRCNGYLSMNVLLDKKNNWKYYYSSNGQFIQDVHDYTEVDCTIHRSRSRNIQK